MPADVNCLDLTAIAIISCSISVAMQFLRPSRNHVSGGGYNNRVCLIFISKGVPFAEPRGYIEVNYELWPRTKRPLSDIGTTGTCSFVHVSSELNH